MNNILIIAIVVFLILQVFKLNAKKEGFADVLKDLPQRKYLNSIKIRMNNILKINPAGLGYLKGTYHENWAIYKNKQLNLNLLPKKGDEIELIDGTNVIDGDNNTKYMDIEKTSNEDIGYKEYNGDRFWNFSHWLAEDESDKFIKLSPNKKYTWIGWARTLGSTEGKEPIYSVSFHIGKFTVQPISDVRIPNDKNWRLFIFEIKTTTETKRPNLSNTLKTIPEGSTVSGEVLPPPKDTRAKVEWGPTYVVPGQLSEYLVDCYDNSQCDEDNGKQCKVGKCVTKEGYCKQNTDCNNEEEKCVANECKPMNWCVTDLNCKDDEYCKDGKCEKKTIINGVNDNTLYGVGTFSFISLCCCCFLILLGLVMIMSGGNSNDEEYEYEE